MKRAVFKTTIVGSDLVSRTGLIRMPNSFRIRIYADGEVVITTRGKLSQVIEEGEYLFGPRKIDEHTLESIVARLSKLGEESRSRRRSRVAR